MGSKLSALEKLGADVCVLSECPRLPARIGSVWIGEEGKKGVGIIARPGLAIEPVVDILDLPKYILPVLILAESPFLLLAVWTKNVGEDRYVRGLHRAIDCCESYISSSKTVVMGDFISNAIWDSEHPRDLNHSALVRRLSGLGLDSAYHSYQNERHGEETLATFYLYRHREKPFHIDYCFLPTLWFPAIQRIEIGAFEQWCTYSDHVPVAVDLDERLISRVD